LCKASACLNTPEQLKDWERRFKQELGKMNSAAARDYMRASSAQVAGGAAAAEFESLEWLEDGKHPLDWNGPTGRIFTRFRDEDTERPIIDHIERAAGRHPNRIAVTDSDTSLSYAELWNGLSGLAETIAAETKPGDLIGIVLPACSMFPLAILACLAAGRPFVALDPHYPDNWLSQVLEDARPALIVAREDVRCKDVTGGGRGAPGAGAARVIDLTRLPQSARKGWRPAEFGVDEPACVVFTSGSTGRAKGIVNSQRNLLQRAAQSINAAHINAEDRFLTLASLCAIVGLRDTITALLAGASVHLIDPQRAGAREILNAIRAEAITILFAFPALLRSVTKYGGERAGDALRLVRVGGDTTLWSDIDMLRGWLTPEAAIQLIYAATEAPMMQWFVNDSCRADDPRIPIGYPLPGNRLALIDEYGRNTPPGEVGELVVGSPYVTLGLWADGRCGAGSMESGAPSCRIFRTGDLVRQRPDGLLDRIGRKDRQVKIRGARVDLDEVEAALHQHPFVRDAGALTRTSCANGAATLVAYVSARDEESGGLLEDLKKMMRSAPPPMRPGRLYLAGRIPRLPGSKLDLRALAAMDEVNVQNERANAAAAAKAVSAREAQARQSEAQARQGEASRDGDCIARTVAQVWQRILQTPVSSPEDDFFEAGGDSLNAIAFTMELERALGLELSLTLISEAPKFAGLCEALREHRTTRYVPLVPLKAGEGLPPVFFIPGLSGSVAGLFPMARRLAYPGAVIGIQARGLTVHETAHAAVEEMAAEYLRAVKARQPEGPYYLCGYSFGGLVAFEMARRLWRSGDEVGLVGLFDTTMSSLRWPLHAWLSIVRRRMVQFAAGLSAAPIHAWPAVFSKMVRRVCERLRGHSTPAQLKVAASALFASARYRPGFYPGKLTLFSPVGREPGIPSLQAIWRKHARTVSIVEIAGTHATMLSAANAASAAASLSRCLPGADQSAIPRRVHPSGRLTEGASGAIDSVMPVDPIAAAQRLSADEPALIRL
jgi:non-ribosomal peptide synthetase component F/thioesterase domain-containing protein/acyl carrier protein